MGEMITPVVKEISRDQALALQREWQRTVAVAAAKPESK
jgi:hypothetical protein